eukprot:EG_transcript_38012
MDVPYVILRRHTRWPIRDELQLYAAQVAFELDMPAALRTFVFDCAKRDKAIRFTGTRKTFDDYGCMFGEVDVWEPNMEEFNSLRHDSLSHSHPPQLQTHQLLKWLGEAGWKVANVVASPHSWGTTECYVFTKDA